MFFFFFFGVCLVDKKGQFSGLCVFPCLCFCVWLTRKGKKILENLGVCFLYLNLSLCSLCGFVFIMFLLKMNLDLNLCIEF